MKLHELLETSNENLNYGNITKDSFWSRGLWMYTNTKELVVHEKTLDILQINTSDDTFVLDEYVEKYISTYNYSTVKKLSEFE